MEAPKEALVTDNMVFNDGKQEVLRLTRAVPRSWEDTVGTAVTVAEDMGVTHYGHGDLHLELDKEGR